MIDYMIEEGFIDLKYCVFVLLCDIKELLIELILNFKFLGICLYD